MSIHPGTELDSETEQLLVGTMLAEGLAAWNSGASELAPIDPRQLIASPDLQVLWREIRERAIAGRECTLLALQLDQTGKLTVESAGGMAGVSQLPSAPSLNFVPELVTRIRSAMESRETRTILTRALEMVTEFPEKSAFVATTAARSLQNFAAPANGFPKPVKVSEWLRKPMPTRREIIKGLLRRGDKLTLGGSSKSKKTWIASDLAFCVAVGKPWMGFETVKTPVLYLNLELPEDTFHHRLNLIASALSVRLEDADFTAWNLRGTRASIESIDEALKTYRDPLGLVVLDPLYKILGGRVENAAEDVADLLSHLEAITTRHGCALAIPAHFSKGNQSEKEAIDRISGSGVFARDADAILTMTAHEDPDCFTLETTLRAYAPVDPFVIRWHFPLFGRDSQLDPSRLKKKSGRPARIDGTKLLELLGTDGLTFSDWRNSAIQALGISEGSFKAHRQRLVQEGRVLFKPENQKYVAK